DKPFFEWITMDKGYARKLTEFGEIISLSGIEQIRNTGNLTAAMEKAGWKADRIAKVIGENWLRVLKDVWGK
ncbi:MAG: membrane dipeptidase, partial [Pseudomonadota bacterium]|nr:membrane dipeptidase [Pseudomonadota bacterium]